MQRRFCALALCATLISEDMDPLALPDPVLVALTANLMEEQQIIEESLVGYTQKQLSNKVDTVNFKILSSTMETSGEREMARLNSLGLPYAGAWLNCPPMPALGLHLRGVEFVAAVKFRLGLPVFNSAGPCPACAATVMSWETMHWCVAMGERELLGITSSEMPCIRLQQLLDLLQQKKVVL